MAVPQRYPNDTVANYESFKLQHNNMKSTC